MYSIIFFDTSTCCTVDMVIEVAFRLRSNWKRGEKRGRTGNTHHVNDVWWTRGGYGVGVGVLPICNLCAINDTVSFLPVKWSTVDLVNLRCPGYRWST